MQGLTPLKRILIEDGRRQNWLAERVGIDEPRLSRIVSGKLHPDEDTRQKIAAALGREIDEIWPPVVADAA